MKRQLVIFRTLPDALLQLYCRCAWDHVDDWPLLVVSAFEGVLLRRRSGICVVCNSLSPDVGAYRVRAGHPRREGLLECGTVILAEVGPHVEGGHEGVCVYCSCRVNDVNDGGQRGRLCGE
jgi:hypothetical protein